MQAIVTSENIGKIIPQQIPFVLVSTIYSYSESQLISGFDIPKNHLLVNPDGFLSEAGLIEHFAQSIALHQGYNCYINNLPAPIGFIGSIKSFKIFKLPKAESEIFSEIEILNEMLGITMVKGKVIFDGEIIAEGEMRTVEKK